MKSAIFASAFASAVVIAQDTGTLPDCAKNCLTQFTTGSSIGNCDILNAKCICGSDSFISGIACCLAGVCDAEDQKAAVDYARSFCSTQGVTDLPQSVTCASAAGTSTLTSAAATTTTPAAATPTPNVGSPVGSGFGANLCGGLLAALAML